MRRIRLREIAYVPQASMNALNPVVNVRKQFERALIGAVENRGEALRRATALCEMVELDPSVLQSFAHQLSGGTRQRLILAMALSSGPRLLIMDEATTGLDVLVQQKIIDRLRSLQQQQEFSLMFVSHDLALIADITNVVAVMYGGRIVEIGPTAEVYDRPLHPFAMGLRRSVIDLGRKGTIEPMSGFAPSAATDSKGCAFAPRCWFARDRCWIETPGLDERDDNHSAACHFADHASEFRDQLGLGT
jgi:oligopeptide/dipeptide ABC transporter ATP-binding protein